MAKQARIPRKAARKPPPPKTGPDDPKQYQRFREFAREHEADEDPETFDRAFRKVVSGQKTSAVADALAYADKAAVAFPAGRRPRGILISSGPRSTVPPSPEPRQKRQPRSRSAVRSP